MGKFLETYGVGIFTLVLVEILIAFAGPLGLQIKEYALTQLNATIQIGADEFDNAAIGERPTEPETAVDKVWCYIDANNELVISDDKLVAPADALATAQQFTHPKDIDTTKNKTLIHTVRFEGAVKPKSCANWFGSQWDRTDSCAYLTQIKNPQNLYLNECTSMTEMFAYCTKLQSFNVSTFDLSNVKKTDYMFAHCISLTSLDVSKWNVSNVQYFSDMFYGCTGLTELIGINKWTTTNALYMPDVFNGCEKLTSLDLRSWDTSKVEGMGYMFNGCTSLTSLNLANWTVGDSTNFYAIFGNCTNLKTIICPTTAQSKLTSALPTGASFQNP